MANKDQSFLDIDSDRLHEEWMDQPKLYHGYAIDMHEAKRDLDVAEARLDMIEAELFKDISLNPVKYGMQKATVDSVKSTVKTQKDYQDAVRDVTEAKYVVGVMQAAVTALDHKKKALESLVQLALADYFSTPRAPKGEGGDKVRRRMDEADKQEVRSKGQKKRVK